MNINYHGVALLIVYITMNIPEAMIDVSGDSTIISPFLSLNFLLVRRMVIPGVFGAVTTVRASLRTYTKCNKTFYVVFD